MRKYCQYLFLLITLITLITFGCSADVNPTRCEINVKQGNSNIPCETGYFDFGNIPLGFSQEITFTIENTGCDDLHLLNQPPVSISGVNKDDFIVSSYTTLRVIAPETSTTFLIKFQPTKLGNRKATIEIRNDDRDEDPYVFMIIGNCTQPAPEIHVRQDTIDILNTTGSYNFGLVNIYDCSKPITFTIENNGSKNLNLTGDPEKINISGLDKSMFIGDYNLTQTTISSGNSTSFTVMFNPSSPGIKKSKVSILNDDSDENPYTFILLGTGVAVPEISVSQGTTDITSGLWTYDFDTVLIYESSPEVIFILKNIGTSALHLSDAPDCVKIIGADPTMFSVNQSSINETLQPGESTIFSLKFSPTSPGKKSATISIANNDDDENPFTFEIKGDGDYCKQCNAIGWIGGGSDGWKTGYGANENDDYKSFDQPGDLCLDSSGNIYIADYDSHRICKWDSSGNAIGWIGGGSSGWKTGIAPPSGQDYMSFTKPRGVFVDSDGYIYVADTGNHRICKWDSAGNPIGWIGDGSNGWKTSPIRIYAFGSNYHFFKNPSDVFVDSNNNIFVADTNNYRISKWDKNGNAIGWIGGGSSGWKTSRGAIRNQDYESFWDPLGLFVDGSGNIFIADTIGKISKWDSSGTAIGWIGGGSNGWKTSSAYGAAGTDYQRFCSPRGVFIDSIGYMYIADGNNYRVCKWTSSGYAIGWIGDGSNNWKNSTAPSYNSKDYQSFNGPEVAIKDSSGNIYIVDKDNNRVCKWKE